MKFGKALKVGDTYKVDPEAHRRKVAFGRMVALGNVGQLEQAAAYAERLADKARAELELARMAEDSPWLVGAPPKQARWFTWGVIAANALLLATVLVLVAMQLRPAPSAPALPFGGVAKAPFGPPEAPLRGRVGQETR